MPKDYEFIVGKFPMLTYAGSVAITLKDIFPNGPETAKKYIQRKKDAKGDLQDIYKTHDRTMLVRIIFHTFLNKLIDRAINDEIFLFPGSTKAKLLVKSYSDIDIRRMRQSGKYKNINLMKTGFKIPVVVIDFGPFSRRKDYRVYIGKEKNAELIRRAENGLISWVKLPKTLDRDVRDEGCDEGDL